MQQKLLVFVLFQVMTSLAAAAETRQIDPVIVSPDNYKVLLENEHVRIVEFHVGPGQKDNYHTHPAKVTYVAEGGVLRITTAEGKSFEVEEHTGSARWFGAVGLHRGENIGATPVRIVYIELKDISGESQDLNHFNEDPEK